MKHIVSAASRRFSNLSLLSKIRLVICSLGLAISTITILISLFYYRYSSGEQALASAKRAALTAANTFEVNYYNILEQFVFACGTRQFASSLRSLVNSSSDTVRLVQSELSALAHCNYLVHSAMILSGDGEQVCTLYTSSLQSPPEDLFSQENLESVKGITLLPRRPSPLRSSVPVIPLLFPLSLSADEYAHLTTDGSAPDGYVILFLDCGKLEESLLISQDGRSDGVYYLMDSRSVPLNADPNQKLPRFLERESTEEFLASLRESSCTESTCTLPDSWLIAIKIRNTDLILLNYVPRVSVLDALGTAGASLLVILLVVLVIFSPSPWC